MNRHMFASQGGIPKIDPSRIVTNAAGGLAVTMSDTNALAQMAMTGCFNDTFYTDANKQLDMLKSTVAKVATEDLADIAVYAKEYGYMKDMPIFLLASILGRGETKVFHTVFPFIVRSIKDLRNFIMIMRSGQIGRRSLGTAAKKACQRWLESRSATTLFRQSYGNDPSFADVIRLVHPATTYEDKRHLYGWFIDKEYKEELLPDLAKQFLGFCRGENVTIPNVPLPMLMGHPISDQQWKELALTVSWQTLRMNLNNFNRHNVFADKHVLRAVCDRLTNQEEISKARIFPYQLYTAIRYNENLPRDISLALTDAMEISVQYVPKFPDDAIIALDLSGSMRSPITGTRKGATTQITCAEVGAIMAATALKANPTITVLGFGDQLYNFTEKLNPRDSILTIANGLPNLNSGTDCSLPLRFVKEYQPCSLLYMISDNESWQHGQSRTMWGHNIPDTVKMWAEIRRSRKQKNALFVCNDLIPNITSPIAGDGVLHVAGYSDKIWGVVSEWMQHEGKVDYMAIIRDRVRQKVSYTTEICDSEDD